MALSTLHNLTMCFTQPPSNRCDDTMLTNEKIEVQKAFSQLPKVTSFLIPLSKFPNTTQCSVFWQLKGVVPSHPLTPSVLFLTRTQFQTTFPWCTCPSGAAAECVAGLLSDTRIPNTYKGGVNITLGVTQIAGHVTWVSPTHVLGGLKTSPPSWAKEANCNLFCQQTLSKPVLMSALS